MNDGSSYVYDFQKGCGWWDRPPKLTSLGQADAAAAAQRLLAVLRAHDIAPNPSSWLAAALRNTTEDLPAAIRDHACPPSGPCSHLEERVRQFQLAADIIFIERAIERAGAALGGSGFAERLRDLASGAHPVTSPGKRSFARDRAFELVCAGAVGRYATDVTLAEPDVLCSFEHERWGVACKVAAGGPQQCANLVKRGAEQLERSDATVGVVVVRATDVFPHHALEPYPRLDGRVRVFADVSDVPVAAHQLALPYTQEVVGAGAPADVVRLARACPKLKAVAFVGFTLANLLRNGAPVPALGPFFVGWSAARPFPAFVDRLYPALGY